MSRDGATMRGRTAIPTAIQTAIEPGPAPGAGDGERLLTAQELLAGSELVHDVEIPAEVLRPAGGAAASGGRVRLRPLRIASLALIARASHDDPSLVPLLMIKDALLEPALPLEQIRQLHAGLVHFLVARINRISGLDGEPDVREAAASAWGQTHVLLARHFGWTPQQVAELTPGQVAVYLSGLERLLAIDAGRRDPEEG